ncbi:hypothetical protein PFISCL1PPCAC_25323, partial [Pristionchus fissidentatus]
HRSIYAAAMIIFLIFLHLTHNSIGIEIDWKNCRTEVTCFAHEKCLTNQDSNTYTESAFFPDKGCSTGFTVRAFSPTKWRVHLQVKVKGTTLKKEEGVALESSTGQALIGCKTSGRKVVRFGKFSPTLHEESKITDSLFSCIFDVVINDQEKTPSFRYETQNQKEKFTNNMKQYLHQLGRVTCNADKIVFDKKTIEKGLLKYELSDSDKESMTIKCASVPGSELYVGEQIEGKETTVTKTDNLRCEADATDNNAYKYTYDKNWFSGETQIKAFCAKPIDLFCNEDLSQPNCADCPERKFAPANTNSPTPTPSILECPGDKWLIDSRFYKIQKMKCSNDVSDPEKAKWYLEDGGEFSTAVCFDKFDCLVSSKLDINPPSRFQPVTVSDKALSCNDSRILTARIGGKKSTHNSITCDGATGNWADDAGVIFGEKARVFCSEPGKIDDKSGGGGTKGGGGGEEADATDKSAVQQKASAGPASAGWHETASYVGYAMFALALIAIIVGVIVYKTRRARRNKKARDGATDARNTLMQESDWNWQAVTDFIAGWANFSPDEKAKFIEQSYAELGNRSTATHMLYILEHMIKTENN